jgi:cell division protein FtsA
MTQSTGRSKYMVGLDVGTTKVSVIVGEPRPDGGLDIIGLGSAPSRGVRRGMVVNLDATVDSIKKAVEEVQRMAGVEVQRALVGIGGNHLKGFNSRGVIAVSGPGKVINRDAIARVIEAARAVSIPQDREVLHVMPQEFILDEQDGIKNPLGMTGTRLEVNVHMITGSVTSAQNLVACAARAGLEVVGTVVDQLAAAEAVLNEDEKELGVALVDIGGGTTNIAIFEKGAVWHTAVLPVGGDHFSNDIAVGLRAPIPDAEKVKKKHGAALAELVREDETVEVPSVGGRKPRLISRHILAAIIEPRAQELFQLVKEEIARAGYEKSLNSGIVLTGGGSLLEGMTEIAEQIFDLPTRRGAPLNIGGLNDVVASPIYSTAVGLVQWGLKEDDSMARLPAGVPAGLLRGIGTGLKSWLAEFF